MRAIALQKFLAVLLVCLFTCNFCIASEIDFAFHIPTGVAVDKSGNIYVADLLGSLDRIYKIDTSRKVGTLVDIAPSTTVLLATDARGNVYLTNGDLIQKIEPSGVLTTLHKNKKNTADEAFRSIGGIGIDKETNIYVTDVDTVRKITPSGQITTLVVAPRSQLHSYRGIAVDSEGNIFVADEYNHTIQKIAPGGAMTTLAGVAGQIGDADGTGSESRFYGPWGIAIDSTDNVYVADTGNGSIRRISPSGIVTTLPGTAQALGQPVGLALDQSGNIYVADLGTQFIHKISPKGAITVFAGQPDGYGHRSSLCRFNETTYFSCSVKGGKIVAVCGSRIIDESRGYLQYRFGKENAVELVLPRSLEHPSKFFTQTQTNWMRRREATLTIRNGEFAYTVYYAEGEGDLENGVLLTKSGKKVADIHCTGALTGGSMFFDESVIKRDIEHEP